MRVRVTIELTNDVWNKTLAEMSEQASRLASRVTVQGEDGWWHLSKVTVTADPEEVSP